jgi:hypothetical protein
MPAIQSKPENEDHESSRKAPTFRPEDPTGWYKEFEGYMRRQDQAHLALINPRPEDNIANRGKVKTWDKRNDYCISYLQESARGPKTRAAKLIVFKGFLF